MKDDINVLQAVLTVLCDCRKHIDETYPTGYAPNRRCSRDFRSPWMRYAAGKYGFDEVHPHFSDVIKRTRQEIFSEVLI